MLSTPSTFGEILALGLVPGHELVVGGDGLGREVVSVALNADVAALEALPAGTLIVFGRKQLRLENVVADVAVRIAHERDLVGLVAEQPAHALPEVTIRLAERLRVPIVAVPGLDAIGVASRIDRHIRAPQLVGLAMVDRALAMLREVPTDAAGLTTVLHDAIGFPVAVLDGRGAVVAGDDGLDVAMRQRVSARLSHIDPTTMITEFGDGHMVLAHPAVIGRGLPTNLWIVIRLPIAGRGVIEAIRRVLAVAALGFTSWLATSSLVGERESRYRAGVLADILGYADDPHASTVERATALGWRLTGWHVGVHVTIDQRDLSTIRTVSMLGALERALSRHGIEASLVQRPGGWVFWHTHEVEPTSARVAALRRRLAHALRSISAAHAGVEAAAGIGSPHEGTGGIGESLREARQACLLARTRGPGVVEDFGAMTIDRLLVGWYESAPLQRVTSSLLGPLRSADPSGELIRTLMAYLDQESSATAAAHILGVHRNTVLQRLERVRSLLPLDLARPNDRLVAHLAVRVAVDEGPSEATVPPSVNAPGAPSPDGPEGGAP